jgi:hypothetical protein
VRVHEVRRYDSPARIAIEYAGCPKCARDLVAANPHKESVVHANGFTTFRTLNIGEKLNLPDKWFNGDLDKRPKKYFEALPSHDGKTPSKLGLAAAGVLSDFTAYDAASATATALSKMDDRTFSNAVEGACTLIDQSVREADGSSTPGIAAYAQAVHTATNAARQRNQDLVTALTNNDAAGVAKARADIQTDLSTAIDAAQLALQAVYGNAAPTAPASSTPPQAVDPVTAAARAAAAAMAADPNFCSSISKSGTAVNAAVHAFKSAWNATNPNFPVPINTGTYEQATADVLTQLLGTAPPACGARGSATPSPFIPGGGPITPPQPSEGLSTGALVGLSLLGVGAVGGAIYLATQNPPRKPRVRRARPRREQNPMIRPRGPRYDTVAPWRKS